MPYKEFIEVDFRGCDAWEDFHERIRIGFNFPVWYGKNLDAFWDLLSEPMEDVLVTFRCPAQLPGKLSYLLRQHILLLEENREYQRNYGFTFDYRIIEENEEGSA